MTTVTKHSVSFPGELTQYINDRRREFGGMLSPYLTSLIERERKMMERDIGARERHTARVRAFVKKEHPKAVFVDKGTVCAVLGTCGWYPVEVVDPEEVMTHVAMISRAVVEHGLDEVFVVLPADATEDDLAKLAVLKRVQLGAIVTVVRLGIN